MITRAKPTRAAFAAPSKEECNGIPDPARLTFQVYIMGFSKGCVYVRFRVAVVGLFLLPMAHLVVPIHGQYLAREMIHLSTNQGDMVWVKV